MDYCLQLNAFSETKYFHFMSLVFQGRIECSANFANSKAPIKRLS